VPWWQFDIPNLPRPLARYIAGMGALGALIFLTCLTLLVLDDVDAIGVNFLAILGLYVATNLVPEIPVSRGGQPLTYRFHEFAALIGVAVGPAYLVPLAALLSETVYLGRDWVKRPHERFKIPFNAAHLLVVVGVTVAIASVSVPPLAFIAAAVFASCLSDVIIGKAMSLIGGPSVARSLETGWQTRVGIPAFVALLASAMVLVPVSGTFILAMVPTVLMLAYKGADEWVRMSKDRDQWRRMDQISSAMREHTDEQVVLRLALTEAVDLFGVSRVEIVLPRPDGTAGMHMVDRDRPDTIRVVPVTNAVLPCPTNEDGAATAPVAEMTPLSATVPLVAAGTRLGTLSLHWPRRSRRREQRSELTSTFAHAVASNLSTARAHEQVRQQAEAKAYEATHDSLTGLGNRTMLYERAPAMLADAALAGKVCAIFVFDLDGFKRINDTLGHGAGDLVLVEVSKRIRAAVRRSDLAVRLGGDEFAVLATDMALAADSEMVVAKLLRALAKPIQVEGMALTVEASIGIAVQGQDGNDINMLLQHGDVAMYEAKNRGHGQAFRYQASSNSNTPEQLALAADLRVGLDRGEIVLHYQPQINLANGHVLGVEALARWQHPEQGMIPPDRFIPLTEHSGLIQRFTAVVLDQAVRDHARLRLGHDHPVTMSVNLSARNLLDQSLPGQVERILATHGVPATELVLEITETIASGDASETGAVVAGLAELGCQVSLDDFGTGYSTLSDLQRNPLLSEIKVDREFTAEITTKDAARVMVDCIIQMAHIRGCRVVAEGVEDAETIRMLERLGCDAAQGFYLARPMPIEKALAWAREWLVSRRGVMGSLSGLTGGPAA
jgi:diguanylate cyclase (GGDEF)-like protein